jgi:hypothetical protein
MATTNVRNVSLVKFTGGPLDGHQQLVSLSTEDLADLVILPAGRILSLLNCNRQYEEIKSLALYALFVASGQSPVYYYLGAVPRLRNDEHRLMSW